MMQDPLEVSLANLFGLSQFSEVLLTWILKHWHYWRRHRVLWTNDKLCAATLRSFPHSQTA
jgi:hypothetical protein